MEALGIDSHGGVLPAADSSRGLSRAFQSQASRPLAAGLSQQGSQADFSAGDLGRQLTQQLTHLMNSDLALEVKDDSPRGGEHSPLVYYLGARLLRSGLLVQLLSLGLQIILYLLFGGNGWFDANLFAAPDALKAATVYVHFSAFLEIAFLLGVVQVAAFQVLIADNSK